MPVKLINQSQLAGAAAVACSDLVRRHDFLRVIHVKTKKKAEIANIATTMNA
jgi:hypothetical protein